MGQKSVAREAAITFGRNRWAAVRHRAHRAKTMVMGAVTQGRESGRSEGVDTEGDRLQCLVQRAGGPRRAGGLQPGSRVHGHSPQRLRHLGADAEGAGPDVQGYRPPERLLPAVHPAELPRAGGGARRGIRARDGGRHPRRRQGAGGAAGRPADLGDDHLCDVRQVDPELPRPPGTHQPVGQRGSVGDANPPVPPHDRVPLAGGAHGPRHGSRGGGGDRPRCSGSTAPSWSSGWRCRC